SLKNIDRPVRIFRVRQAGDGPAPRGRARGAHKTWALALGSIAIAAVVAGGLAWWVRHEPRPRAALRQLVGASTPAATTPAQKSATAPAPAPPAQQSAA